jgi:hypothetical protein
MSTIHYLILRPCGSNESTSPKRRGTTRWLVHAERGKQHYLGIRYRSYVPSSKAGVELRLRLEV